MAISKHRKKGWRIEVETGPRGSRRRLSKVVQGSRSAAEKVEFQLLAELRGLRLPDDPRNPPLKSIVESYMKKCRLTMKTVKTAKHLAGKIVREFGGTTPARSVTQEKILIYLHTLRRTKCRTGENYKPATIDQVLVTIKAIYNNAIQNELIDPPYNPARFISKAKIPNERQNEITDENFLKILQELDEKHRLIWLLARFTGLRSAHLLSLRREQIREGIIRPQEFDPLISFWQSTKRHGMPPVPPSLLPHLVGIGPLFLVGKNQRKTIWKIMVENRKAIGMGYWFHDLRRTYANWLRRMGISFEERLMCMGHSPHRWGVSTRYQVVTIQDLQKVGERIDADPFFQRCMDVVFPERKKEKEATG